jgi:hypothetical protein
MPAEEAKFIRPVDVDWDFEPKALNKKALNAVLVGSRRAGRHIGQEKRDVVDCRKGRIRILPSPVHSAEDSLRRLPTGAADSRELAEMFALNIGSSDSDDAHVARRCNLECAKSGQDSLAAL